MSVWLIPSHHNANWHRILYGASSLETQTIHIMFSFMGAKTGRSVFDIVFSTSYFRPTASQTTAITKILINMLMTVNWIVIHGYEPYGYSMTAASAALLCDIQYCVTFIVHKNVLVCLRDINSWVAVPPTCRSGCLRTLRGFCFKSKRRRMAAETRCTRTSWRACPTSPSWPRERHRYSCSLDVPQMFPKCAPTVSWRFPECFLKVPNN
jgi:hypothetical protein